MAVMNVADFAGVSTSVEKPLTPGQAARSASRPVTLATEDITALTATQTISGTVAATQSGTWNIGSITTLPAIPAGTNNIGDVDVLTLIPGTSATSLGKAIDGAAGSTDTGVAMLAIRDDALTTLVPVDGDWTTVRVDSNGAQWVRLVDSQVEGGEYEAVPSTVSTTTTLGTTGGTGDFLSALIITPLTLNPGSISIKDGSDTAILIFQGGTASVSNLVPFTVSIGASARNSGGWQVVTGSGGNVQAMGVGNFT